jgi:type IV secretion system protein VirD4
MMDNRYALLFIRGERPILDDKYDILKHPNVALTTDGKAKPYQHGAVTEAVATIFLDSTHLSDIPDMSEIETEYELLSDEDIEAIFENKQEETHNEKSQKE